MDLKVKAVIQAFIAREFIYDNQQTPLRHDFPLVEENIIDSLGIFRLIAFLEEQFDFKLEPEDIVLENFETINAIDALVASYYTT